VPGDVVQGLLGDTVETHGGIGAQLLRNRGGFQLDRYHRIACHAVALRALPVRPGTKLAALVVALRRPQGATNLQLMLATGWQPHSVRGAISGLLRKRLGPNVVLTLNAAGERVYRLG
jgi:hypothetical protein